MKDDKDVMQQPAGSGTWCEPAALPEQAGRSAWLEGRVLALFRLGGAAFHALDGGPPGRRRGAGAWPGGDARWGAPWSPARQ